MIMKKYFIQLSLCRKFYLAAIIFCLPLLSTAQTKNPRWHLITLDPGHFHAALVQKTAYPQVDPLVYVYAPESGGALNSHLALIDGYNQRAVQPTNWQEMVYAGKDFFEKMIHEKKGNVVVLAGNNKQKTDFILKSVEAGLNVFADKPMAINSTGFAKLVKAFDEADKKGVVLFDIMTERYQITNALQKALSQHAEVFGELQKGTTEDPAVQFVSVHHFLKTVSGKPLIRPGWYFDVRQQGEGIVDVSTHLVDLAQWSCFSRAMLDYKKDLQLVSAKRWPTRLTRDQFKAVTGADDFPDFLQPDIIDNTLHVYANGELNYRLKGVHVKISVIWNYTAPAGSGDTEFSMMKGTKANLVIRQGAEQGFRPELYIEPVNASPAYAAKLQKAIDQLAQQYPGLAMVPATKGWKLVIPNQYRLDHETTFGEVTKQYLKYLQVGSIPEWEKRAMLTKYYTTTEALKIAQTVAAPQP